MLSVRHAACVLAACLALALAAATAQAGPREQAKRIHDRLVGIPPSDAVLTTMEGHISGGNPLQAAFVAMNDPEFYTTALKGFVTPWTNEAGTPFAELNDYSATVIGMIRDDVPFNEVLSADLVYVGAQGVVQSGYSHTDNDHYVELETARVDLSDPNLLVATTQSGLPGSQIGAGDTAGVLTTRAAGLAFFRAGTNRRMFRFTAMNYLCRDMEDLSDVTRPADRIRQDVTRSPGGDSQIFLNACVGCHSGMDPMAQAFAYFNFDEQLGRVVHTPGQVQPKYLINATVFPAGYITASNAWENFWRTGQNSVLGWGSGSGSGFGAKGLGQEISATRAFSVCQAEKVFEHVCFRPPGDPAERAEVDRIADEFEASNYSMRRAFAEAAVFCMGN